MRVRDRRMHIGFLINTTEPFYHGGYETRAWDFARALARRHRVTIYTSCGAAQEIEGVQFRPLAPEREYFNQKGVRNLTADATFALAVLKLWAERDRPDILDACATPYLHLRPAKWVARRWGVPLVATVHEALLHAIDGYVRQRGAGALQKPYAALLRGVYHTGLRAADHRLAVSPNTARELEKEGYPADAVVEFGLDLEQFPEPAKDPPRDRPLQFIWVGRLTAHKQVETALLALHGLGQDGL
ncbi:MAG: glycosyltransferase family 4 protein, partial [Verrucomicrobiota bacterium]